MWDNTATTVSLLELSHMSIKYMLQWKMYDSAEISKLKKGLPQVYIVFTD